MARIKDHFVNRPQNYIFSRVTQLKMEHASDDLLDLGVGDAAYPLSSITAIAIQNAVTEMTDPKGMRGYGPEVGYPFLRDAFINAYYEHLPIHADEIIVTDGIVTPITLLPLLMDSSSRFAIQSPTYPAYLESMFIRGAESDRLTLVPPVYNGDSVRFDPPDHPVDVIILCSPHNPTGTAMTRDELKVWVDYAREHDAIILFDGAYQSFISRPDVPRSIYEIPGANEVAIEFMSLSKPAGFTGLRCGFVACPKQVTVMSGNQQLSLLDVLKYTRTVTSNGTSYPIQRGAAAALSFEGHKRMVSDVGHVREATQLLAKCLKENGATLFGGVDSPYIWWKTPEGVSSEDYFKQLLIESQLVCIPGSGFGAHGEGFVRLSGLISLERAYRAAERLQSVLQKESSLAY